MPPGSQHADALVLTGATLIDGTGAAPVSGRAVVVQDGRIQAVVAERQAPPAKTLRLDGLTLLPGLINCHVHLCFGGEADRASTMVQDCTHHRHPRVGARAADDRGRRHHRARPGRARLCRAERARRHPPRDHSRASRAVRGQGHLHHGRPRLAAHRPRGRRRRRGAQGGARAAAGRRRRHQDLRHRRRDDARCGRTWPSSRWTRWPPPSRKRARPAGAPPPTPRAATGSPTACRAASPPSSTASSSPKRCASRMARDGVALVPTLIAPHAIVEGGVAAGIPEFAVRKSLAVRERHSESFQMALRLGVPIAAGTDAGTPLNPHGSLVPELELMVKGGLAPLARPCRRPPPRRARSASRRRPGASRRGSPPTCSPLKATRRSASRRSTTSAWCSPPVARPSTGWGAGLRRGRPRPPRVHPRPRPGAARRAPGLRERAAARHRASADRVRAGHLRGGCPLGPGLASAERAGPRADRVRALAGDAAPPRTPSVAVTADSDLTLAVTLEGLAPDREYQFRAIVEGAATPGRSAGSARRRWRLTNSPSPGAPTSRPGTSRSRSSTAGAPRPALPRLPG